ncbi:MAG: SDR family oxidoreductase [Pseudomonadota bacterium]
MTTLPSYPDLKDASVLITGGGSGIGAALTRGFTQQGAKVAFIDIAEEASVTLVSDVEVETGIRPLFLNVDLADAAAVKQACETAAQENGPVTVLVNNAAWDDRHDISDVNDDYWQKNTAINLRHPFLTVQSTIDGMIAKGVGSIINFTSTSFMLNIGDMPTYTASKAGMIGFTKGLAGKYGQLGIRANCIAPGWVMTARQKELWATPEAVGEFMQRQAIGEELTPEQMVGPTLFLASAASSAITAQTIIADHGVL